MRDREGTEGEGRERESFLREGRVRYGIKCGRKCEDDEYEVLEEELRKPIGEERTQENS